MLVPSNMKANIVKRLEDPELDSETRKRLEMVLGIYKEPEATSEGSDETGQDAEP